MEDLVRENDDGSDGSGYGSIDWEAMNLVTQSEQAKNSNIKLGRHLK